MGVECISPRTYFRHQKQYIHETISAVWEEESQWRMQRLAESKAVVLGGDGRNDSVGHSAKYGSYSFMDLQENKVIDIQTVQVQYQFTKIINKTFTMLMIFTMNSQSNEVKSSNHMELEGLKRGIRKLEELDVKITAFVTDRHTQVQKWFREIHPKIKHFFDVWHVSKGN